MAKSKQLLPGRRRCNPARHEDHGVEGNGENRHKRGGCGGLHFGVMNPRWSVGPRCRPGYFYASEKNDAGQTCDDAMRLVTYMYKDKDKEVE